MTVRKKFKIILETEVFQKLKLSKNCFNKKFALLKSYYSELKKNLKSLDKFGH